MDMVLPNLERNIYIRTDYRMDTNNQILLTSSTLMLICCKIYTRIISAQSGLKEEQKSQTIFQIE